MSWSDVLHCGRIVISFFSVILYLNKRMFSGANCDLFKEGFFSPCVTWFVTVLLIRLVQRL